MKSLTLFSAKTLLQGIKPFVAVNFIPASSLSTQEYNLKPLSVSDLRLFGFSPAIDTRAEFCILSGFASCLNESRFTALSKTYTPYEAQQQMRKMERAMRKQKDLCITTDARGEKGKADFTAASIKLRRQKDIYEDFCKQTGNYTEYERTFVQRYNRHLSGKTGAVTRKQRAAANT